MQSPINFKSCVGLSSRYFVLCNDDVQIKRLEEKHNCIGNRLFYVLHEGDDNTHKNNEWKIIGDSVKPT